VARPRAAHRAAPTAGVSVRVKILMMGEQNITTQQVDHEARRTFMKALLADLSALEQMLVGDWFETDRSRIGAEQEMFLVDQHLRPSPSSAQVLSRLKDPRFTTEIAKFNLEANLTPREFEGRALHQLELEIDELLGLVRQAAEECDAKILLTGILPTLKLSDLTLANLTDMPRYHELNRSLTQLRGTKFNVHLKGLDEIHFSHDSIMVEACNTSFQIHYQVAPAEFANTYNIAQAITAPVLAASVNSPLLFGQRLWAETRLALFQHSVDERSDAQHARFRIPRVSFGQGWVKQSILELFRQDVARFRVLLTHQTDEDPVSVMSRGEIPKLTALRLHNGTVWRWNRPCYGIMNGKPHLRIENRVLPAGPTVLDEIANASFFFGLMSFMKGEYRAIDQLIDFDDANGNFFAAARQGLRAQFRWFHGKLYPAVDLILKELLPVARLGLQQMKIDSQDIDRYLGVIEERVHSGQTGSQWILDSLARMGPRGNAEIRSRAIAMATLENQMKPLPVHQWPPAEIQDLDFASHYRSVAQIMSTDLYTVRPDDIVDYVASIMHWEHIRHVPVEDENHRLVGLISQRTLLPLLVQGSVLNRAQNVPVSAIMVRDPIAVTPETDTLEALKIMREKKIGCLLVVKDQQLVGIITLLDLLGVSIRLFEEVLKQSKPQQ
jgi:CBS domain-containing protein